MFDHFHQLAVGIELRFQRRFAKLEATGGEVEGKPCAMRMVSQADLVSSGRTSMVRETYSERRKSSSV